MLRNDAPECARIWGANGLAFKNDRSVAVDQWAVTNVGMSYDPSHIRRRPEHIAGINIVDRFHRPMQRNQMARCRAHNAFGRASRA